MENILYNISQVLGITIIHSLWQGLLIYFLLRLALVLLAGLSSSKKYLLAVSSLLAITGWFACTLVNEIQIYDWLAVKPTNLANMPLMLELPANIRQFNDQSMRYYYSIEEYLPYITLLYVAGLLTNAGRLVIARKKIYTIKQTMSIDVILQQQISRFAEKFDITKKVKVGLSKMVDVPCIVGYFKPVILLPFTLSTYLSEEEIEAILMHELAHIKRNDYLVNVAQQVITSLLFFNPCVLLINKIIGEERENCCDDLVVDAMQSPVIYAKALFKLEQTRQNELQLALAVTGKKYHLLNRIERIMKTKKQTISVRPTLVAMLILTIGIGCMALLNPEIAQGKISVKAIKPAIENFLADTIRKKAVKTKAAKAAKATAKSNYKVQKFNENRNNNNNHNFYYNDGLKDPQLDKLTAEVDKHANAIGKYYESDVFKSYSADMEKRGKEIDAFYNNDKMKELTAAQEKLGAEFEKKWGGKNSEMEKLGKQMEGLGKQVETYFNSPEFKEMNAKLEKKYGVKSNGSHDESDENYKKYQEELKKNLSPQINQQTEQMKKLGEEMRNHYGAAMRKDGDQMRRMGDSMRRAFDNPRMKQQQDEMRKMGDKMRAYADNPEIKKQKELLKQATDRLKEYTSTPEFKAKVREFNKNRRVYNWDDNGDMKEIPPTPPAPEAIEIAPPPAVKEVPVTPPPAPEVPVKP
jgi:beta-lactamase regulating signal transducer with metallopeptidase domain